MNERRKMISFIAKVPPRLSELFGIFEFLEQSWLILLFYSIEIFLYLIQNFKICILFPAFHHNKGYLHHVITSQNHIIE